MAARETENQHSDAFTKNLFEDVLNDFEISKRQILALVTDNASNMTLGIKKLSEDCEADESKDDGSYTEPEVASILNESMNSVVFDYLQFTTMSLVGCAAHTLQLAIREA